MQVRALAATLLLCALPLCAQTAAPDPGATLLNSMQREADALNMDVGKLRIEKWKADGAEKQREEQNVASIQRNITAALPELMAAVRANPQSLAANFKLYRNLSALYDVLSGLGESAGAFGKKEDYDILARHVAALDDSRRAYGDYLQQLAADRDTQLANASARLARPATAAAVPKKIVVDDTEPAPKTKKKKKPAAAAATPQ